MGCVVTLTDISERKQAAEALRQERDFAESLIETAQAIVVVLDPAGRIVRTNPYLEELAGYQEDEIRGKDWFTTFVPERDRPRRREIFAQTMAGITTRGFVNPIVTKSGRECTIAWSSKAVKLIFYSCAPVFDVSPLLMGQESDRSDKHSATPHRIIPLKSRSETV